MEANDSQALLPPATRRGGAGPREILCVLVIAITQTAGAQLGKFVVKVFSAPFLVWFGTSLNLALVVPMLLFRNAAANTSRTATACNKTVLRDFVWVTPFFVLWVGANLLYTIGLAFLPVAIVSTVFSITPTLVALLSVPVLKRQLTALSMFACILAAGGIILIAHPWDAAPKKPANGTLLDLEQQQQQPDDQPALGTSEAALCVVGAACCAASYKVLFRRWHGDAPASGVLFVVAMVGLWMLLLGTPVLLIADPSSFAVNATAAEEQGEDLKLAWTGAIARAALDLAFNYFIAYGISLIHPLFISIGTLLSTPLNVLVSFVIKHIVPSASQWGGMLVVLGSFAVLLLDEKRVSESSQAVKSMLIQESMKVGGNNNSGRDYQSDAPVFDVPHELPGPSEGDVDGPAAAAATAGEQDSR